MILPLITLLGALAPSVVKMFTDSKDDSNVIDKIKSALGLGNISTEEFIKKLESDSETKAKLMALEYDYKVKLAGIEFQDRENARTLFNPNISIWSNPQFIMAFIGMIFVAFMILGIVILEAHGKDTTTLKDITFYSCGSIMSPIIGFFFGDSHSNANFKKLNGKK